MIRGDDREVVTSMTDQPGPRDPAERRAADRPGKSVDLFGDLQRWFIRQSAKNMRNQISGQVRRTIGGGRENSDVWDTATNEIPPEVGESPECQWCPICRAARRMRDSGPGIGDQISGAGDVVASAVQDAIGALDSLLSKAGSGPAKESTGRDGTGRDAAAADGPPRDDTARDNTAKDNGRAGGAPPQGASSGSAATAGNEAAADPAAGSGAASPPTLSATEPDGQQGTPEQQGLDRTAPEIRRDRHGLVGLPGGESAVTGNGAAYAGGSSPAGKPADRPAAARDNEPDPWGAATASAEADQDFDADILPDRPGHEPDDRG
jgi:hypothetical protein